MEIETKDTGTQKWVKLSDLKKLTKEELEAFLFPDPITSKTSQNEDNSLIHCF